MCLSMYILGYKDTFHACAHRNAFLYRMLRSQDVTEQMWVDYMDACSLHVINFLIADNFIRCKCYGALERLLDIS